LDLNFNNRKKKRSIGRLIKPYSFLVPIRKLWRIMGCKFSKGMIASSTRTLTKTTALSRREEASLIQKPPRRRKNLLLPA